MPSVPSAAGRLTRSRASSRRNHSRIVVPACVLCRAGLPTEFSKFGPGIRPAHDALRAVPLRTCRRFFQAPLDAQPEELRKRQAMLVAIRHDSRPVVPVRSAVESARFGNLDFVHGVYRTVAIGDVNSQIYFENFRDCTTLTVDDCTIHAIMDHVRQTQTTPKRETRR